VCRPHVVWTFTVGDCLTKPKEDTREAVEDVPETEVDTELA
jgi:hypothetical protein